MSTVDPESLFHCKEWGTMRQLKSALAILVLAGLCAGAFAQGDKPAPKITLSVAGEPAAAVAAKLTEQGGVQVGVAGACTATPTLDLTDATLEDAVKAFAESIEASWIRAYVLEKQPPATPYTADQLLAGLANQRATWYESLDDEQRGALMESWRGAFGGRGGGRGGGPGGPGQGPVPQGAPPDPNQPAPPAAGGQPAAAGEQPAPQPPPQYPGAGRSNMMRRLMQEARAAQQAQPGQPAQPAQGGPGGPGGFRGFNMEDPVANLIIPVRTEAITLQLQDVPLAQALFDLTTVSGFIVAAGGDLAGNVTLDVKDKPIDEVLTQIATAVGSQWRPIYILSVPRELTEAEQEQRAEARFQRGWARYWALAPAERATEMQQRVDRLNRMAERAKEGGDDGARAQRRLQRMGSRMMRRMTQYSAGLDPARRQELAPLIRAMGQAMAGQ
jgi:hypothetical protein